MGSWSRSPIGCHILGDEPIFEALMRHKGLYLEAQAEPSGPSMPSGMKSRYLPIFSMAISPSTHDLDSSGVVPVDLQDLAIGHEVQDISISLLPLTRIDDSGTLSEAFRSGYTELRIWPSYGPDTFDALFAGRRLLDGELEYPPVSTGHGEIPGPFGLKSSPHG